jgi:hypothetical protein
MSINPSRPGAGKRPPATYWRRRFITLVIGLTIFAVIAWALSGALGRSATVASEGSSGGAHAGHQAMGPSPGSAGSASRGTGRPGSASPSPSISTTSPSHGSKSPAKAASNPAGAPSGRADGQPSPCHRKEIVLSLFSSQRSADPRARLQFEVDVVSTSTATCGFNAGPKYLALMIKAGTRRIWSSADCVKGPGSLVTDLRRGVPVALPITWDRQTSTPGCAKAASRVPAGRYSVTAIDGALASNTKTVRVR